MDITMSRVRLASDTLDIYFTYTKVLSEHHGRGGRVRAQVYNYTIRERSMEEEEEENLPSPATPVLPPKYRPTTSRAVQPVNHRPTTAQASVIEAVQGRYSTGTTAISAKTGTTGPLTGTTALPARS